MYQAEQRKNNERKADEYFEEAKKYYFQAIAKDPESLDANYSVGALYYNMAASRTQALNETEDLSAAGMKKYEKLKAEIMDFFNLALPYFKKAESLDPNDLNTLTALSEIFTRKDDALLASEMKKRLTTVKSGGSNRSSYFH